MNAILRHNRGSGHLAAANGLTPRAHCPASAVLARCGLPNAALCAPPHLFRRPGLRSFLPASCAPSPGQRYTRPCITSSLNSPPCLISPRSSCTNPGYSPSDRTLRTAPSRPSAWEASLTAIHLLRPLLFPEQQEQRRGAALVAAAFCC